MDKLIKYNINNDIAFCPIALNNIILQNQPCRGGSNIKMEEERLLEILAIVESEDSAMYILDFSGINKLSLKNKNISRLFKIKNAVNYLEKAIFPDNLSDRVDNIFICDDQYGHLVYHNDINEVLKEFVEEKIVTQKDFSKTIHIYAYISFFLRDAEKNKYTYDIEHLKYLETSNIYVNSYINIKSFFLKPTYMYLLINDMTELVKKGFSGHGQVCLLGVSNNGIILSRLIAYQLQWEVKSINHIGPKYCLDSDSEALKELTNKKYILISDVICLGGEYRIAKGIIEALGAKLLGAVCVVKIRGVYRNKEESIIEGSRKKDSVYSLIENVNQYKIDGKGMEYEMFIDTKGAER